LRTVQRLPGHIKVADAVRSLGVALEEALSIAERTET